MGAVSFLLWAEMRGVSAAAAALRYSMGKRTLNKSVLARLSCGVVVARAVVGDMGA